LALSEFVAMEAAYQVLRQLDPGARQRALHWLTDALAVSGTLPQASNNAVAPVTPAAAKPQRRSNRSGRGERAYRRMPDAAEVMAAYRQVGSVSALADHFDVPRHTVQGWARRLRREGYDIGRGA
jgi:hypothetical protein